MLQRRYDDFNVYWERKIIEKLLHPPQPGISWLATQPGEWRWSSFRHGWTGDIEDQSFTQGRIHSEVVKRKILET